MLFHSTRRCQLRVTSRRGNMSLPLSSPSPPPTPSPPPLPSVLDNTRRGLAAYVNGRQRYLAPFEMTPPSAVYQHHPVLEQPPSPSRVGRKHVGRPVESRDNAITVDYLVVVSPGPGGPPAPVRRLVLTHDGEWITEEDADRREITTGRPGFAVVGAPTHCSDGEEQQFNIEEESATNFTTLKSGN